MAILYPAVEPINISIGLGSYSVSRDRAPAGSTTLRQRSSLPFGFPIAVDYGTIADDLAADFFICWNSARGTYRPLTLPSALLVGIATELKDELPTHVLWYFAEPPTFSSSPDVPGYTETRVVLEAEY